MEHYLFYGYCILLSGLRDLYPHILISEVTVINKYKHTHEPSIRQRCILASSHLYTVYTYLKKIISIGRSPLTSSVQNSNNGCSRSGK
jgi:hypothetical protein